MAFADRILASRTAEVLHLVAADGLPRDSTQAPWYCLQSTFRMSIFFFPLGIVSITFFSFSKGFMTLKRLKTTERNC